MQLRTALLAMLWGLLLPLPALALQTLPDCLHYCYCQWHRHKYMVASLLSCRYCRYK